MSHHASYVVVLLQNRFFLETSMEEVNALPELLDPDDFDLDDSTWNVAWTSSYIKSNPTNLGTVNGHSLYQLKTNHGGDVAVLTKDRTQSLYVMNYIVEPLTLLNSEPCATQTKGWKAKKFKAKDVAYRVLTKLLQKYRIVICDMSQTPLGKSFWEKAMLNALRSGLEVGFANFEDKTISRCVESKEFNQWLWNLQWAWKYNSAKHRKYRFFINRAGVF